MKADAPSIHHYTISDVSIDAGRKQLAKDFLTFRNDELKPSAERMGKPWRSAHFSIGLVIEGEGHFQINLINYHIKKNSLIVIPFNVIHQLQKVDDGFIVMVVNFSHDFLAQARFSEKHIPSFGFFSTQNNPYLMLDDQDAHALHEVMKMLHKADDPEYLHPFKTEIIHHSFNIFMFEVAALFKKYRPDEQVRLTRKEEILSSFIKLLFQHFKEERGVQFYADELYLTPKHLTKMVKELTNKTCGEMIDELVIIEAKIMLDDLGLPVSSVAQQLQFSDQFFFSKFFKKHTGINPSKYKGAMKYQNTL
ncbi:AraC-like DNA-binding protein [Mucilaginibacter oryzae]|uniref:AraC-like DNA-binding protein n=1 Tax=Mucilaginibacter oryzae TaxID=468058 RepID=A0A316HGM0_9SPHI|nr:AraC family transcriptional regulator [Mucilaginibacter oryzae]PWK79191.1 AraC-like DNA-binding protein [Mucilaginibacter oryzae]